MKKINRIKPNNKKKSSVVFFTAALLSLCLSGTALSGSWQQNEKGWWWQNNDGSYPAARWVLLDGNRDGNAEYYYFDEDGYLVINGETPDGRTVNEDGALVRYGKTVTRSVMAKEPTSAGKLKATLNPDLPFSLLGKTVDELQNIYGDSVQLSDKADSLEYITIDSDGLDEYQFIIRRGIVKSISATPEQVLEDFDGTTSLQRLKTLLNDAGMFVDADSDFMLKAYYSGCEFLFEYHEKSGVTCDSPVLISLDEP